MQIKFEQTTDDKWLKCKLYKCYYRSRPRSINVQKFYQVLKMIDLSKLKEFADYKIFVPLK